jgi:adenylate cyclase
MKNLEIKGKIADVEAFQLSAVACGAKKQGILVQKDTYFPVREGRLKVRQEGDGRGELIFYRREEDGSAERWSDWSACPLADPAAACAVLGAALGVKGVVEKERTLYLFRSARIHIDRVMGLGDFFEIESKAEKDEEEARQTFQHLLQVLPIDENAQVQCSYIDLLEKSHAV